MKKNAFIPLFILRHIEILCNISEQLESYQKVLKFLSLLRASRQGNEQILIEKYTKNIIQNILEICINEVLQNVEEQLSCFDHCHVFQYK